MSASVSVGELYRIGRAPLSSFGTEENIALACGTPQDLAYVVRSAQEMIPPNVDVLSAVYGACVARAGHFARQRRSESIARAYYTVAEQAMSSVSASGQE